MSIKAENSNENANLSSRNGKAKQAAALLFGEEYLVDPSKDRNATGEKAMYGMFGLPPRFNENADHVPKGFFYGRHFLESMLLDGAVMGIIPGKPEFIKELSDDDKKDVAKLLNNDELFNNDTGDTDKQKSTLEQILQGKYARYYSFLPAMSDYFNYVNMLLHNIASMMGVVKVPGIDFMSSGSTNLFDWEKLSKDYVKKYHDSFGTGDALAFYLDVSQSNVREDYGNSTTQSMLADKFKGVGAGVREAEFLSGGRLDLTSTSATEINNVNEAADPSILKTLKSSTKVITSGGNLVFPDIWADSSYNKSIEVGIKLQSPSGALEDIFLYIIVPYIHLLCLTLPRQVAPNGYISPFLIRAFSKGWFNCDMGIIESMSISKGSDGAWSIDGYPTEMVITLNIVDLYKSISINDGSDMGLFFSNIGLIDHLCTLCGISMHEVEIMRSAKMYMSVFMGYSMITSAKKTVLEKMSRGVSNSRLADIFRFGKGV